MNNLILIFSVIFITFFSVTVESNSLAVSKKNVQSYFDAQISEADIPGIQYIVVDEKQILYEFMGGWADIASQTAMQNNITMMAYSQTKTITAAAVLHLVDNGKLDLEQNVDFYLSDLPYKETIKIKQLISQTSGIPDPIPLRWAHLVEEHATYDENEALDRVLKDNPKLTFEPGDKYQYSNISYWLLGKIIEKVSGVSYEEYVRLHIFKPLKISPMDLDYTIQNPKQHAKGYLAKYSFFNLIKGFLLDKKLIGETSRYENNWLLINNHYLNGPAFGGLVGTARGFAKFLQDQLQPTSIIFSKQVKELFYEQQKTNDGKLIDMTLGWHIGHIEDNTRYFFKEGGGGGFHSEMRIYPDQDIATVIMVNKTNFKPKKVLDSIDVKYFRENTE